MKIYIYESFKYSHLSYGIKIEKYTGGAKSVNIPEYIDSLPVTTIGAGAFYKCESLFSIKIPNTVTSIGFQAFSYCTFLCSIQIPNSVTSIGNQAFNQCWHLTSIQIPNSVTSIGEYAFSCCTQLKSVQITNPDTKIGRGAFFSCNRLESIQIPNSIERIYDDTFDCCNSLTSIQIPNSVNSIGDRAFYDCESLISIQIPTSATLGEEVFAKCNSSLKVLGETGAEIKKFSQNTASSQDISGKQQEDDFSTSKVLFWFAIFIFIVVALVASFTGISFGNSLLLTVVGIVALIIWLGR